jgi:hypothetical protein
MNTIVKTARAARAAVRTAFPRSKISTTSCGDTITIRWTNDGPSSEKVQEALLNAGCAVEKEYWGGKRGLVIPFGSHGSYWLDCYNAAERAAELQERERRQQEWKAETKRVTEAITREYVARRCAWPILREQKLPPVQDASVFAAFEALRVRAETEVKVQEDAERRSSAGAIG